MNKCFFIGRLVNDPEISSYEKNGESQAVAKYRLAINKRNKENQKVYTVDFIAESQEFTETKNTVEARQNRDEGEVPFK